MGQNQNIQRMVGEINKLITNELLTNGGIYLPNIGSLRVEVCESSPRRTVKYYEAEMEGFTSLVGVVALKAKCNIAQSTKLYEQWYEAVKQPRQVEIEGIGTVRGGRFEVASNIERRLNPAIVEPKVTSTPKPEPKPKVKIRTGAQRRGGSVKYIIMLLVVVAIIAAISFLQTNSIGDDRVTITTTQVVEEQVVAEPEPKPEPEVIAEPEPIAEPIATQKEETKEVEKDGKRELITKKARVTSSTEAVELLKETLAQSNERTATKYKVAYGVYSSQANAGRAIIDAMEQDHDTTRTQIGVTLRNGKYMVTLFESDHFYTSVSYMKRNDEYFDNALWVYDPDKM